jgi:uncharacterized membrane protein
MEFSEVIEFVGKVIDGAGVAAIVVGAIVASVFALARLVRKQRPVYRPYRSQLGRSILLGLELLVAARWRSPRPWRASLSSPESC